MRATSRATAAAGCGQACVPRGLVSGSSEQGTGRLWQEATHWSGKVSPNLKSSTQNTFVKGSRHNYRHVHFPGEDSGSQRGSDLPKSTKVTGREGYPRPPVWSATTEGHLRRTRCPERNGPPAPAPRPPKEVLATWAQHPGSPRPTLPSRRSSGPEKPLVNIGMRASGPEGGC